MKAPHHEPKVAACRKCGAALQGHEPFGQHCLACLLEAALSADEGVSAAGERFDHYRLTTDPDGRPVELGRGAMGITYQAIDTVLGHPVALKVIDASIAADPPARERFLREARAAAQLRHPNVASVFHYGVRQPDGQCFYVMELIEGETLQARLQRQGPLAAPLALEVVAQVAGALGAAEAQGLVHRDLKPSNLMLVSGPELAVKVIDFGLAKAAVASLEESTLTDGGFVGTPAFASPEQCAGRGVDGRSDLYALGITLWVMLTGQPPFRGSTREVMRQHLQAPVPFERLGGVPQPVAALLGVLLEKEPAGRFQSAAQCLEATLLAAGALQAGRPLPLKGLQKGLTAKPSGGRPPPRAAARQPRKVSLPRLPVTGGHLFGRQKQTKVLSAFAVALVVLALLGPTLWWFDHKQQQALQRMSEEARHITKEKLRAQLLASVEGARKDALAQADKAPGGQERERLRQAAEKAYEGSVARIEELAASFAELEGAERSTGVFNQMSRILAEEGVEAALAYAAAQRPGILETVKARAASAREKNRAELLPLLKSAQLQVGRNRPEEAERLFTEVLDLEPAWAEARNAFASFLIQQGHVIEPAHGNAKLRQAVQICQGTLALNPRENSPRDWAATQNNLGVALRQQASRTAGPQGTGLLAQAVAAFRRALEVYIPEVFPADHERVQHHLTETEDLSERSKASRGVSAQLGPEEPVLDR